MKFRPMNLSHSPLLFESDDLMREAQKPQITELFQKQHIPTPSDNAPKFKGTVHHHLDKGKHVREYSRPVRNKPFMRRNAQSPLSVWMRHDLQVIYEGQNKVIRNL